MVPPKEGRTTRVIDETYLQYLEAKIRANPNAVVAPLVANITLPPGNQLEEGLSSWWRVPCIHTVFHHIGASWVVVICKHIGISQ